MFAIREMPVSEQLYRAMDEIEIYGLAKTYLVTKTGSVCAQGACMAAVAGDYHHFRTHSWRYWRAIDEAGRWLIAGIAELVGLDLGSDEADSLRKYLRSRGLTAALGEAFDIHDLRAQFIATFNNAPSTTDADVILALKHAAVMAQTAGV